MEYQIGGKTYTQDKLTVGQAEQLWELLKNKQFPELEPAAIMAAMGADLYKAIAVVLREKGVEKWWVKDLDAMAEWLKWEMSIETGVSIIIDFLSCNLASSLLRKIDELRAGMKAATTKIETHSPTSQSCWPGGTSSGEQRFDGM